MSVVLPGHAVPSAMPMRKRMPKTVFECCTIDKTHVSTPHSSSQAGSHQCAPQCVIAIWDGYRTMM